ncbi:MAG: response regulator transcription factor [Chloroflexi bacterium]|nr:response regulator transcription factor [Chloroflexota bacterium]
MNDSGRASILVVEDEDLVSAMIRDVLAAEGFEVHVAADGAAGLAAYEAQRPDCIVLDLAMPLLDGLIVLEAIRQRDPTTQILVLSAHASPKQRASLLESGADDFLPKPFDIEELIARVRRRVFTARQLRGASEPTGSSPTS